MKQIVYIGLDGDSIGREIERNIINNNLQDLRSFSHCITKAIEIIRDLVESNSGDVIFYGGDSILFSGSFDEIFAQKIIDIFRSETNRTASVGIGNSPHETYLGLKLAKSYGGNRFIYFKKKDL
ncbi:MAG TPA: mCpol domain-containing protein [Chitinophagales bacterium]|nr:mCpol domain-containing protein [Chitinophagales bacterium]